MKELLNKFLPEEIVSKLGFTPEAEILNGRLAMLGFLIGVLTELLSGYGVLEQLGLK